MRAEEHGEGVAGLFDVGIGLGDETDGAESSGVGCFADEERLALHDEQDSDGDQQDADDDGGDAVGFVPAEVLTEEDSYQGNDEAQESGGVFKEDGEDAGVFAVADGVEDGLCAAFGFEFADADDEGVSLEEDGHAEDGVGPGGVVGGDDVADMGDSFGDGDAAAEDEDEEGDDEGPEVKLFAVAEGMGFVGGAAAEAFAEEEKAAVAAVDEGVDGLGEHGGGAGEKEADDLGGSDAKVGEDGDVDAFVGGGHWISR